MTLYTPEKIRSAHAESSNIASSPAPSTQAETQTASTLKVMESEQERIAAIRRFNRFYTQIIGVLDATPLKSGFSLAEIRILYDLAHRDLVTAALLSRDLDLDPGYLSRILRRFDNRGLIKRIPSSADGRWRKLSLTDEGRKALRELDTLAQANVVNMLSPLTEGRRQSLVEAMQTIEAILTKPS